MQPPPPPLPKFIPALTPDEIEVGVGEKLRALRLVKNLDQAALAKRAGVSLSALKSLEGGRGSTLHTLVRVARALGREDWFSTIAPVATVSPLDALRRGLPTRQRAARRTVDSE